MTLSRKEHAVPQTKELKATKIVVPQVIEKGTASTYNSKQFNYYSLELNVVVVHDNCSSVKRFIIDNLNIVNSFDTWHGEICFTRPYTFNIPQVLKTLLKLRNQLLMDQ